MQVTVWNEYRHERESPAVAEVYPDGIHDAIAEGLRATSEDVGVPAAPADLTVRTATLDDPDHGLDPATLSETDVLTWWGHRAHDEVRADVVDRVVERVRAGMGLLVLHSGHYSKPFKRLMGTSCALKWRENAERERVWVVEPGHPVADGLPESFVVPEAETYGERFDVPAPDALVFTSWFEGGEVFRSGCGYRRGKGRVFYFRPGHETHPIYYDDTVRRVLANAVAWAAPGDGPDPTYANVDAVEGDEREGTGTDGTGRPEGGH
jgi:trehalose utilization protein